MASRGMGVVYTATHDGRRLREAPDREVKEALLDRWYRPHHALLEHAVTEKLESEGQVLIIDAHSFPARPFSFELDQSDDRPEICIGTDDFHTPAELTEGAVAWFEREGFAVATNRPYAGSLVPMSRYRKDQRVRSLMVEVRRDLYLQDSSFSRGQGFQELQRTIGRFLEWIGGSE
jgi:N-formylglutamate amidohydrolase